MLPTLEGVIRRRVLLNFRADPSVVASLLPPPFEVLTYGGFAIVGVCLIGMEQLRPKGFPAALGLSSENMAHRVAIRYPTSGGMKDGVFIWRRETDQCLVTLLGGRLFPGVHQRAHFTIDDTDDHLAMDVVTEDGGADVGFEAVHATGWAADSVFQNFADAAGFFQRGDCGFSCSLQPGRLDALQLKTHRWEMSVLRPSRIRSTFFQDGKRFRSDLIHFDCALLMRGISHEWREMDEIPELAAAAG